MSEFARLSNDLSLCLDALDEPRSVPVSVGAAEALFLDDPGGYSGPWIPDDVPYLIEPMDCLASRQYETVDFCGPARTGKTAGLILGWIAHALTNDIGRMMVMHMTETKANHFSKLDVESSIDASPRLAALKSPRREDNNIGLRRFINGMAIRFAHPTSSETAGTTYRYVALTDYDRYPQRARLGGEIYTNAHKRSETLMSRRMTLVESSPEREIEDPNWQPKTPHEAPPVSGVLGIYNQGDRRRWYWPCPHCGDFFEAAPGLSLFVTLPSLDDLIENIRALNIRAFVEEHAQIRCPHCEHQIEQADRHAMNAQGRWLKDGESIDRDGNITGDALHSTIASFWLGGVAAAYQTWEGMLTKYLQGVRQYAISGSEESLRASTFTDLGMPYMPRHLVEATGDFVESRQEDIQRYYVPPWTRFLLCSVDVQGGQKARFVVQVHAIGVDMESAIVDRYDITNSPRSIDKATGEILHDIRIDPASYPEDWEALTDRVINATYRIDDERELQVYRTVVDYGGEDGVSANAAAWRQGLRRAGFANRVMLSKGDGKQKEAVQQTNARDRRGRRMRDVPLLMFSADQFKDMIAASMRRTDPGPTFMHFPQWLKQWFFDELRAEIRDKNGKWKKIRARNEALDCWSMIWALAWFLGPADPRRKFNWMNPPRWAAPLDNNSHVLTKAERRAQKPAATSVASARPLIAKRAGGITRRAR